MPTLIFYIVTLTPSKMALANGTDVTEVEHVRINFIFPVDKLKPVAAFSDVTPLEYGRVQGWKELDHLSFRVERCPNIATCLHCLFALPISTSCAVCTSPPVYLSAPSDDHNAYISN
jgi:hypothetical protein